MSDTVLPAATVETGLNEDWLAAGIGLLVVALAIAGTVGPDLLGWVVTTAVWTDPAKALAPARPAFAAHGGLGALLATYLVLLAVLTTAAAALRARVVRFAAGFTVVFAIAYASWFVGSYAGLAAVTPAELQKFGLAWSLRLTSEGGFIVALLAGLAIGNFFPRFAAWLGEAIRPELSIKIAIVILGAFLAFTVAGKLSFASSLLLRGIAAIIEAYLIYWAVVYFGRWSISSPGNGSASAANGRRRWLRAFRSAASRLPSRRAAPSAPGPACRCWWPRWW